MKNALVLDHHYGDDGDVSEGMILRDLSEKRFAELEKRGLVREATDIEVKAGYQPPFTAEADEDDDDGPAAFTDETRRVAESAQAFINDLNSAHEAALKAEIERADAAEKALAEARQEIDTMKTAHDTAVKDLASSRSEIEALKAAKQDKPAANKKAADPANKSA